MKTLVTEFIGTFFLVLTIGLVAASQSPLGPLAVAGILVVMVYMGFHISGAHFNPATSLAVFIHGKITAVEMSKYMAVQLLAAIVAALVSFHLTGGQTFVIEAGHGPSHALIAEFLFTFALVLVIFQVAVSPDTAGNSYYGLAIGVVVMAGIFAVEDISGAAFNPAVGLGPMLVNSLLAGGGFSDAWIYVVGPLAGGAAAAMVYRLQSS